SSVALLGMAILPLIEIPWRRAFGLGIPGAGPIVQHLVLWVAFLGAAIAARDGKLLSLSSVAFIPEGRIKSAANVFAALIAALVATLLAAGAVDLVRAERAAQTRIGADIPTWIAQLALPIGFAAIALRLVWRASETWYGRVVAAAGVVVAIVLAIEP